MENELRIFEGIELDILTKDDVNIEFNGECLFNGVQVCTILNYGESDYKKTLDRHCDEDSLSLITKAELKDKTSVSLKQRGTYFINEDGVMDLIYNSNLPKAKEFKKKVREIVKEVQATGKYDSIEQQLKLIEDETEKNLKLTIYQYENIVKMNPSDVLSGMMLNNKKNELNTYLQSKEIKELKTVIDDNIKRLDNICVIGDRQQFTNEINSVARATGKQQSDIYILVYRQLLADYGIDLKTRSENKKKHIQNERLDSGKKPLSPSTLKQKVSCLVIADEMSIWNEMGKSLFAVKNGLLNK